ncbi:MAG: 4Fe-4S binding protein [Planctomycetota bacterium]
MRQAWSAVVFALGFLALVAQALLFRPFLASFEGNELGIGAFFGSWLLWVAMGALLGRAVARRPGLRSGHFALLALLYLPAFVLQDQLIAGARTLGGVVAYELFPLHRMVAASLLANAPISLVTGFLFTLACRCSVGAATLPVARVYVLESLGSFAGGLVVTLLLARGFAVPTVFLCAGSLLALTVALFALLDPASGRVVRALAPAPFVLLLVLLATGADGAWAAARDRAVWGRLLPEEAYRGSFTTAQAKYLYGEREGQFVVMAWGGVTETLPATEHASEVLALTLAQHPGARRALVVGPGSLALCQRLAQLPQIERVAWLHPDPAYPRALWPVVPARWRGDRAKLEIPEVDVRAFLDERARRFDLVLLNLPDVTTLVLNRYATREFFARVKGALAPGGVVALRTSGGANYLGSELVYLGSSAYRTLAETFAHVALKPGEESWFLASDGAALTVAPAELRDRFAGIEGAAALFPPEGLLSLYPPDRIDFQMTKYRATAEEVGAEVLLNTDREPKALLYSLAVSLRQAGRKAVSRDVTLLLGAGARVGAAAFLVYLLLRLLYLIRSPRPARRRPLFDATFLVFSTGLAGMSLSVVLLFLFQARFGSLYLHAGLVFSLFMLGLFLGGLAAERLLAARRREHNLLLPSCLALHLGLLAFLLSLPREPSRLSFGALFVLAGLFTGIYFPIAAHRLKAAGRSAAAAGSRLETIDHLGGAVGAVVTGLVLLPVLGTPATVLLLALVVVANLVPALLPLRLAARAGPPDPYAARTRAAGYGAFGVAAWLLVASSLFSAAEAGRARQRLEAAARELSATAELRARSAQLEDGSPVAYFEIPGADDGIDGHVFSTAGLADDIHGYQGPITLAVHVDLEGTLRGFRVLRSRETPAYLARLDAWRATLVGRRLYAPDPFAGLDAVTGATMSSRAILSTLDRAGRRFAAEVLGRDVAAPQPVAASWLPDRDFCVLALLLAGAILLRYLPRVWPRRLFLATSVVMTGLWLNLQFSTQHVFSLLSLELPPWRLTGAFFMIWLVPVVVLLAGNVYCGYLCPFGALQELVGDLRRRTVATDPRPGIWRYARTVKYALLAILVVPYAWTRDYAVLAADPLITFFGDTGGVFLLGIAAVALSLVFRRFWCRNLCPAGAFLALLNGVMLLRRVLPRAQVARCDLGVRTPEELDCLRCDRCRHETS